MSRQIMSKATPDPYLKERARQIGTLGEAIRNLSVTLHDTSPEEWHQAVQPLIAKLVDSSAQFEQELTARTNQYVQTGAMQRRQQSTVA